MRGSREIMSLKTLAFFVSLSSTSTIACFDRVSDTLVSRVEHTPKIQVDSKNRSAYLHRTNLSACTHHHTGNALKAVQWSCLGVRCSSSLSNISTPLPTYKGRTCLGHSINAQISSPPAGALPVGTP